MTVPRPWEPGYDQRESREGKMEVADRAFGNALRAVVEQAGCPVNSINRMDGPWSLYYPQFGTFAVTTRC